METNPLPPRTRCIQCISCANAVPPRGPRPAGCAAGAAPPEWTQSCEHFVHDWRPMRVLDRRRPLRQAADRRNGGRKH